VILASLCGANTGQITGRALRGDRAATFAALADGDQSHVVVVGFDLSARRAICVREAARHEILAVGWVLAAAGCRDYQAERRHQ
jgi:hypothetical protein